MNKEQIEQDQEPVAWLHEKRREADVITTAVKHVWGEVALGSLEEYSIPLYLHPQPIPEGYKLVPIEPTRKMMQAALATDVDDVFGVATYKAMIAVAPKINP